MTARTPQPWSFSALDKFVNCPKQFYEVKVVKSVTEAESKEMRWGNYVHRAFEDRVAKGKPLPNQLQEHEEYIGGLADAEGVVAAERKLALDKQLQPCGFFDKGRVWWRGIADYSQTYGTKARIIDYKTGKPHSKFQQIAMTAVHAFMEMPQLRQVEAIFYWTQAKEETSEVYTRADVPKILGALTPDLRQYANAFKHDVWQPRPSGLCHGWCPVTHCEHWKPKKKP